MRAVGLLLAALLLPLGAALPSLEDDAGSGRDAGEKRGTAVPVTPGVVYEGGFLPPADAVDAYLFEAAAGEAIEASFWPGHGCLRLFTPEDVLFAQSCGLSKDAIVLRSKATIAGEWMLALSQSARSVTPYRFGVGVADYPPDPTPHKTGKLPPRLIQPGQQVSSGGASCTLNFAFDGTGSLAGRVFVGSSAHCFRDLGAKTSISGARDFGRVVYMGDYASVNAGSHNNGIPGIQSDFALVEVLPAFHHLVEGEVLGHPGMPTAVKARSEVRTGDLVLFSGYGTGAHLTQPTREMRVGVYVRSSNTDWGGIGPIMPGDSGGPVLHADGKALGVAAHLNGNGAGGPWLYVALAEAAAAGWPVELRTAG